MKPTQLAADRTTSSFFESDHEAFEYDQSDMSSLGPSASQVGGSSVSPRNHRFDHNAAARQPPGEDPLARYLERAAKLSGFPLLARPVGTAPRRASVNDSDNNKDAVIDVAPDAQLTPLKDDDSRHPEAVQTSERSERAMSRTNGRLSTIISAATSNMDESGEQSGGEGPSAVAAVAPQETIPENNSDSSV